MIANYLHVLNYPKSDRFDINDIEEVVSLVNWLEDRIIRELEIGDRQPLRNFNEFWDNAFSDYLEQVGSPFQWHLDSKLDCICWLLNHGIGIQYEESAKDLNNLELIKLDNSTKDSFSEADVQEFEDILNNILRKMNLLDGNNTGLIDKIQLITKRIRFLLPESTEIIHNENSNDILGGYTSGVNMADPSLNQCIIILKMLHMSDFRDLQNDLNELIILGQEYTANPKTNSSLGKVGK